MTEASPPTSRSFVTTDWLAARLGSADVVAVDATYFLPNVKRDAGAEFLAGHIPGAVRFDLDAVSDHSNPLPHMLPSADQFAREIGALGIADTDTIVCYDALGMWSSPRAWWTFRLYGAQNVFVLEGGRPSA
jgi:thiosulfate/3-mercaptopyruvate sulfurtransferase